MVIALFKRFKLAIKYRAAGCPSPWRWAGTALRRGRDTGQTPPLRSPPPPPDWVHFDAIDRLEKTRQRWYRGYGCDKCHGTGWIAVTMRQIEKCRCVPTGRNPDPHPSAPP